MQPNTNIESAIKSFILEAFLPGANASEISDNADLVAGHIVDSINVLRLVEFMEENFEITVEHDELRKLTSIANIAEVIRGKLN